MEFALRPSDTLHDLCRLVNDEWMQDFRGDEYGVDAHMWHFEHSINDKSYKYTCRHRDPLSRMGSGLVTSSRSCMTMGPRTHAISTSSVWTMTSPLMFVPCASVTRPCWIRSTVTASGNTKLDVLYPELAKCFSGSVKLSKLFLFKPGREKYFGYVVAGSYTLRLVGALIKFDTVEELLSGLEKGLKVPATDKYTWEGRFVYPTRALTAQEKSARAREGGGGELITFWEADAWEDAKKDDYAGYFRRNFPKCHRAYTSKNASDCGWMVYQHGTLRLCRGAATSPKHNDASLCFKVADCFEPKPASVVACSSRSLRCMTSFVRWKRCGREETIKAMIERGINLYSTRLCKQYLEQQFFLPTCVCLESLSLARLAFQEFEVTPCRSSSANQTMLRSSQGPVRFAFGHELSFFRVQLQP